MKYALVVTIETASHLLFMLPRFRLLNGLKSLYLRILFGARIGRRVVYYPGIWIFTGRFLSLALYLFHVLFGSFLTELYDFYFMIFFSRVVFKEGEKFFLMSE